MDRISFSFPETFWVKKEQEDKFVMGWCFAKTFYWLEMAKIISLCHSLFVCVCEIYLISEGYHSAVFKIKEVDR